MLDRRKITIEFIKEYGHILNWSRLSLRELYYKTTEEIEELGDYLYNHLMENYI